MKLRQAKKIVMQDERKVNQRPHSRMKAYWRVRRTLGPEMNKRLIELERELKAIFGERHEVTQTLP